MGCIASKIDKEERVRICKERKVLMKQLVGYRSEFSDAQLSYLRALKNTGVTLRQLTESESLEIENTLLGSTVLPPSPPPPLPPSPPPPPSFSPHFKKTKDDENAPEEILEINDESTCTPPPPPIPSTNWDFWDPFAPYSPESENKSERAEHNEEENWAEANTEFENEGEEKGDSVNLLTEKEKAVEFLDDGSSMMSWHTKNTMELGLIVWRNKTLGGIVKELDDYFLKASAVGHIVILVDVSRDSLCLPNSEESNRRSSNSAKVLNALAWSWSSRSLQYTRTATDFFSPSEPCRPGAHCVTLEKLYAQELKLYKDIKDTEITKLDHEKKSLLLVKQEEDHDPTKTEKIQLNVESLQSEMIRLKESICRTCACISKLIEEELHPQIIAITTGLMSMWRTIYECHQVQNHISRQLSHLTDHPTRGPTTEYHQKCAAQLKTEVTSWYNSFCRLVKSQGEYVRAFRRWVQLTILFTEDAQHSNSSSAVLNLCEQWQLALDRLPDKVASEAIKSFLAAVNSIVLQQQEELNLHKKSDKLERKLQRELNSLSEMEIKLEGNLGTLEDVKSSSGSKHPYFIKRAKVEALKKRSNDEKAKYLNSVQVTRAMTMSNLRTSLPNVFEALMAFSNAYTQSLELMLSSATSEECDGTVNPLH